MVRRDPQAIGVFARMADREFSFTWLCPLLTEDVLLIADARSLADISSVEAAKGLRVGVLRASPSESSARALGSNTSSQLPMLKTMRANWPSAGWMRCYRYDAALVRDSIDRGCAGVRSSGAGRRTM